MRFDHLSKALVAAVGQALASAQSVPVPPGGSLLWGWFMDLSATRSWHQNGPNPISYVEIDAYARMNRWSLQPHHVEILRAMDAAYVEDFYAKRQTGGKSTQKPVGELNAALFDAVFG